MLKITALFLLLALSQSVFVNQTYVEQELYGQWTNLIQANQNFAQLPAQHYLCGFQFLQQKWSKLQWNCNCGRRWYRGRRRYRCNWCDNWYATRASGFKGIFCHYSDWNDKITKTFITDSKLAGNWRNVIMCPKDYYANGIAGKYGAQQDQLLGFHGLRLKCSKITLSDSQMIQEGPEGAFLATNEPRVGNFISSYKIKFAKGQRLWGFTANYEGMPIISKINMTYNTVLEPNTPPVVIDSQVITNCASNPTQQTLSYTKTYQVSSTWTTSQSYTRGSKIQTSITVKSPSLPFSSSGQATTTYSTYKEKTQSFSFQKQITTTFSSNVGSNFVVSPWKQLTINNIIRQQRGNVPYRAVLTFVNRYNGDFLMNRTIDGIWEGVTTSAVQLDIKEADGNCTNRNSNLRN